jgi:hypothetical protein
MIMRMRGTGYMYSVEYISFIIHIQKKRIFRGKHHVSRDYKFVAVSRQNRYLGKRKTKYVGKRNRDPDRAAPITWFFEFLRRSFSSSNFCASNLQIYPELRS